MKTFLNRLYLLAALNACLLCAFYLQESAALQVFLLCFDLLAIEAFVPK